MKLKKLLEEAEILLNTEDGKRKKRMKDLKSILEKLRKREKRLNKKIAQTDSKEDKKRLNKKMALAHAQRKKGLKVLKRMRREKVKTNQSKS